jgi:Protein kinase domain
MTCPACDSRVPAGSRFCPSCGAALSLSATPTVTITPSPRQTPVEQSPPKKSSPKATHLSSSDSLDEGRFVPGTTLIGRYRIVALLGRGGMGEVYRADDLKLGQAVAMKFLPEGLSQDGAAQAGFHREVRLARQVSHPNVCRVFDIGEADERTFLTMEYVDGEDLASLLRRIGRLPSDKAWRSRGSLSRQAGLFRRYWPLDSPDPPAGFSFTLGGHRRQLSFRAFDFCLACERGDLCAAQYPHGSRRQARSFPVIALYGVDDSIRLASVGSFSAGSSELFPDVCSRAWRIPLSGSVHMVELPGSGAVCEKTVAWGSDFLGAPFVREVSRSPGRPRRSGRRNGGSGSNRPG